MEMTDQVRAKSRWAVALTILTPIVLLPVSIALIVAGVRVGHWVPVIFGLGLEGLALFEGVFYGMSYVKVVSDETDTAIIIRNGFRQYCVRREEICAVKVHYFPSTAPWSCPQLVLRDRVIRLHAYVEMPPSVLGRDLAEVAGLPISKQWSRIKFTDKQIN